MDLLLDASYLISHAHRVRLNLFAHFEGFPGRFTVSRLDHLAHIDLLLRQIHHLEVAAYMQLLTSIGLAGHCGAVIRAGAAL